jgi:hypothetical protein
MAKGSVFVDGHEGKGWPLKLMEKSYHISKSAARAGSISK